jgi:hypothetical protein
MPNPKKRHRTDCRYCHHSGHSLTRSQRVQSHFLTEPDQSAHRVQRHKAPK